MTAKFPLGYSLLAAPSSKPQSVDELSLQIKETITNAPALRNVAVRGELQSLKRHSSGHVYFTLVGKESRIASVLFRSHAGKIFDWPQDGDEVMVTGSVDVYPRGGSYQLYATRILPIGLGAQSRAKEELRAALEKEGLFDIRHKRPLPKYPSKVAVITSPTGAAIQDILKISANRSSFVDVVVLPAVVQGVDAPAHIVKAFASLSMLPDIDCVILARGGGARDDLSPFDDERIVRAVRSCPLPVVTGVGHQTDSSLADLAADAALPTPSAAAEKVFPEVMEIDRMLLHRLHALRSNTAYVCDRAAESLDRRLERIESLAARRMSEIDVFLERAFKDMRFRVENAVDRNETLLASSAATLDALSPLAVLGRGYSICRDAGGRIVRSVDALSSGDDIHVQIKDGDVTAEVKHIHKDDSL